MKNAPFDRCIESVLRVAGELGVEVATLKRDQWYAAKASGDPGKGTIQKLGGWTKIRRAAAKEAKKQIDYQPPVCDLEDESTDVDVTPVALGSRTFVVTWAQNATPLEDNFWAAILNYCSARDATLLVIRGRYRNPTSIYNDKDQADDWWDPRTEPFALKDDTRICDDLVVYGGMSIQPTAVRPLTGLEVFSGTLGGIFGHPKIQLSCIAGAGRGETRVLTTTGAATVQNYTQSKAGKKGYAHHVYGAAVVDMIGDRYSIRQINATSDGCFTDLDLYATPYGVEPAMAPDALILGDIHHSRVNQEVLEATLTGPESLARTLCPRYVVYHDVLDFQARSHHALKDPDKLFELAVCGQDRVEDEVLGAIRFIDEATPQGSIPVVVASNHDEHFDRWLKEGKPNLDPINARFFHEVRALKLAHYEEHQEWVPALELLYRKYGQGRARMLRRGESFVVGGIECGFHGDVGLNGARGSLLTFAKLGVKTVIAHGHTPAIMDGAVQVGTTSELDMGYNLTPSSWLHAHCLIYHSHKRSLVFVRDGFWR